jgi:uncharacterized membrane protein
MYPDSLTASHGIMLGLLLGFAIAHSGLAALRPWGESKIGARLYRVIFALVSIPFATILIIYFFNHLLPLPLSSYFQSPRSCCYTQTPSPDL